MLPIDKNALLDQQLAPLRLMKGGMNAAIQAARKGLRSTSAAASASTAVAASSTTSATSSVAQNTLSQQQNTTTTLTTINATVQPQSNATNSQSTATAVASASAATSQQSIDDEDLNDSEISSDEDNDDEDVVTDTMENGLKSASLDSITTRESMMTYLQSLIPSAKRDYFHQINNPFVFVSLKNLMKKVNEINAKDKKQLAETDARKSTLSSTATVTAAAASATTATPQTTVVDSKDNEWTMGVAPNDDVDVVTPTTSTSLQQTIATTTAASTTILNPSPASKLSSEEPWYKRFNEEIESLEKTIETDPFFQGSAKYCFIDLVCKYNIIGHAEALRSLLNIFHTSVDDIIQNIFEDEPRDISNTNAINLLDLNLISEWIKPLSRYQIDTERFNELFTLFDQSKAMFPNVHNHTERLLGTRSKIIDSLFRSSKVKHLKTLVKEKGLTYQSSSERIKEDIQLLTRAINIDPLYRNEARCEFIRLVCKYNVIGHAEALRKLFVIFYESAIKIPQAIFSDNKASDIGNKAIMLLDLKYIIEWIRPLCERYEFMNEQFKYIKSFTEYFRLFDESVAKFPNAKDYTERLSFARSKIIDACFWTDKIKHLRYLLSEKSFKAEYLDPEFSPLYYGYGNYYTQRLREDLERFSLKRI